MSMYAPVDDMDGKTPSEVLRELAWTRRQRNDLIRARDDHAKARGEAEHRRSKAERALDDARRSFKGALNAMGALPRTITTAEELDALPYESVVKASDGNVWESLVGGWFETASRVRNETSSIRLPATVLHEPEADQ